MTVHTYMRTSTSYRFPFAKFPAVRLAFLFSLGVILAKYNTFELSLLLTVSGGIFFIWLIFEFVVRPKFSLLSSRIAISFYLFLIVLAAAILFTIEDHRDKKYLELAQPIELFEWEEIKVYGTVIQEGKTSGGRQALVVEADSTGLPGEIIWKMNYKIRLYGNLEDDPEIVSGSKLIAIVTPWEFPEKRNPHEFDYGKWLQAQGISSHGEINTVLEVKELQPFSWERIRSKVQKNVDLLFSEQTAPLAKALLLGHKEELTPETKQHFARAGLSHIMAVSGLHVGFIVAPFWILIPYFWGSNKGKWLGLLLLTFLLTGYAGLTGFSSSVCRASLMAWLLTYGKLFHKVRDSINLTAVAAIILLIISPKQLFDVGFQLSFGAVFIILLLMPEAKKLIPLKYRYRKAGSFFTIILVSIVVQVGLFPILIYYFEEFSIIGPVANALVVPVLSITVPAGLLMSLMSPLVPDIIYSGIAPVEYSLLWIGWVASGLGSLEISFIEIEEINISLFLFWSAIVGFVATLRTPSLRWKYMIGILIAANLYLVEEIVNQPAEKKTTVTFLDVGQGDAAHIKTPNGKHILVDAGRWSPSQNSGERVLLPYFEELGIDHLDALILSHPHADHIGGTVPILQNLSVEKIYQSNYQHDSNLFHEFQQVAEQKGIDIIEPKSGELIDIEPSIRLFVLAPTTNGLNSSNPNNHSLVFKFQYGQNSVLFSGDAEKEQEHKIAGIFGDFLKSDIYKVSHHASKTSSTKKFISEISPEITVASLAFRNVFRHPSPEAVNRLHQYSDSQKYTSLSGAITFRINGNSIEESSQ